MRIQLTLEIKHCFITKLQMSYGPSVHQQKRTSGRWSDLLRIPWVTRNSAMDPMTSGNGGALSAWSYGDHVRPATVIDQGKPDSNLGYSRQAYAVLGEFWSPRGFHKTPEFGNDIQNAASLVSPPEQTDGPFLGHT